MAMAPMPLDAVFQKKVDAEKALQHPLFKQAAQAASKAYGESEKTLRENPGICGCCPDQSARQAFLHVLMGELGE